MREHGCLDFREFKEYANEGFWKFGKTPDRLNGLGTDADEELYPERKYRKETGEQLTPECFIREVAADYIRTLTEGIRAAIRDGAAHTYANGLDIREETLDWLFITGGGSNIFFMKDWLLGNLPKEISTLNLAKIKANPERLLGLQVENKTLSCVEGGLVYTGRFILSAVADYSVELEIYPKYGKNRGDLPIFTQTLKIMEKGVALPLEVPFDMSVPFEYKNTLNGFEVTMNLLQNNMEDLSKKENLGKMASGKNALAVAKDVGKVALETGKAAGPAGLMIAVGGLLEGGRIPYGKELARMGKAAWINNSGNIQGKVNDLKSNLNFSRSHDEILKIGGCFRVDENRVLTGMISVKADSMKENQKPLEITLN